MKGLLLDVMHERAVLSVAPDASPEEVEKEFIYQLAKRAMDPEDHASAPLLTHLLNKTYSNLKPVTPEYSLENFPTQGTAVEKADAVCRAVTGGSLPADVGALMISSIKDTIAIEEVTELKARLQEVEAKLGIDE